MKHQQFMVSVVERWELVTGREVLLSLL